MKDVEKEINTKGAKNPDVAAYKPHVAQMREFIKKMESEMQGG